MDNKNIKKIIETCISVTYNLYKLIYIYSSVFCQLITEEY